MSDCPWFVDTDPLGVDGEILYCVWPGGHDGDHALWGPTTAGLVWVLDAELEGPFEELEPAACPPPEEEK